MDRLKNFSGGEQYDSSGVLVAVNLERGDMKQKQEDLGGCSLNKSV